ncbi:hypothetical protein CKN80_03765 [Carnobacterium divergens]|uniref:DUF3130 family protein n=1 Tax=Carnobacterium divergens TaxID=2748 RepID=UPI001071827B|nr:DUF3130 family protein [Carnobacterium divergens]TFJ46864.1 hypothetical protein CKN79_03760 [Carnobacterium divergens]TFJ53828.1 hypothetical protein CKN80_03765 [Carnobacterium divergens]
MAKISTHTAQADTHAKNIKKSVKSIKFSPLDSAPISYSDGASVKQLETCLTDMKSLLKKLEKSCKTDADHIQQINQTLVEKDQTMQGGLDSWFKNLV